MLKNLILCALLATTPLHGSEAHHKDAYASATISDPQLQQLVAGLSVPVYFDNDLVAPYNIKHPYQLDTSQFCVKRGGAYLIGWKMNLANEGQDTVTLAIRNMGTDTLIPETSLTIPVHGTVPASAQFIIPLDKGSVLKLNVESQNGRTLMVNPTFFITRVGH